MYLVHCDGVLVGEYREYSEAAAVAELESENSGSTAYVSQPTGDGDHMTIATFVDGKEV